MNESSDTYYECSDINVSSPSPKKIHNKLILLIWEKIDKTRIAVNMKISGLKHHSISMTQLKLNEPCNTYHECNDIYTPGGKKETETLGLTIVGLIQLHNPERSVTGWA